MTRPFPLLLALAVLGCRGEINGKETDEFLPRGDDTQGQASDTESPSDTEDTEPQPVTCPEVTLSATAIDFSDVDPDATHTEELTVTNDCEGEEALVVAASLSGEAEFALDTPTLSLAPGEQGALTISFSPRDRIGHSATLALATNDTDEESIEVPVTGIAGIDDDGDGYASEASGGSDCDDTDADVNIDAEEVYYDGVDSDCDGASDYDADGDGFDSDDYGGDDCDDADGDIHPEAEDTFYDGVDSDCDGASDYDADGDGFDSEDYGGDDCDDADSTVNPDAAETYYDGVDSDCDGASDYDADGDGFDSEDYSGDDCDDTDSAINPDATETYYDGVDADCDDASDYDADGDGYDIDTYGGDDCDDTDATVNPDATEVWNGADDDCDDGTDNLEIDEVYDAQTTGDEDDYLGFRGNLTTADVDDDGDAELVVGAVYGGGDGEGQVYVLSLPDYASWTGTASTDAEAVLTGDGTNNYWGNLPRTLTDADGDGVVDILVGGNDYSSWAVDNDGEASVGLYEGGSGISGTVAQSSAWVTLTDGAATSSSTLRVAMPDMTGDGLAEVVGADPRYTYFTSWWSSEYQAGAVVVFDGDGLSGSYAASDGDWIALGDGDYDSLGATLAAMDLDDDGYDDLLMGAYGDDEEASDAGAFYVVYGASTFGDSGDSIEELYDAKITGSGGSDYLGFGQAPLLADVDNDGAEDLVMGAPYASEVYVLFDASTLASGVSEAGDFDLTLEGPSSPSLFGIGLAAGDIDADGYADLLVGGSDEEGVDTPSAKGMTWLFSGADLATMSSGDEDDAVMTITGASRSEVFGQSALLEDVDEDGQDDVLVNAPAYDSDQGRVYVLLSP